MLRFVAGRIGDERGEGRSPGASACVVGGALHVDIDAGDSYDSEAPAIFCPMCACDLKGGAS